MADNEPKITEQNNTGQAAPKPEVKTDPPDYLTLAKEQMKHIDRLTKENQALSGQYRQLVKDFKHLRNVTKAGKATAGEDSSKSIDTQSNVSNGEDSIDKYAEITGKITSLENELVAERFQRALAEATRGYTKEQSELISSLVATECKVVDGKTISEIPSIVGKIIEKYPFLKNQKQSIPPTPGNAKPLPETPKNIKNLGEATELFKKELKKIT